MTNVDPTGNWCESTVNGVNYSHSGACDYGGGSAQTNTHYESDLAHYAKGVGEKISKTLKEILNPTPSTPQPVGGKSANLGAISLPQSGSSINWGGVGESLGNLGNALVFGLRYSPFVLLLGMEGDTPQEGPVKEKQEKFKKNLEDIENNPDDWEETAETTSPTTGMRNKGGQSIEKEFTNKNTGEKIYEHILKKKDGSNYEAPHYRPYPKQK
ncbi:hypothetical protein [Paenibacillus sp. SI8]|uniref:hypothetical protein n=1 Tax=unclassified Paenibacillus TaxID=185978 RepID=UPI003465BA7A